MSDFDLAAARKRVNRIRRLQALKNAKGALLPITAHVASIVTIFGVWFMRTGSFQFRPEARSDWGIAAVLLLVAISGIALVCSQIARAGQGRFVVRRKELRDLVAVARADASISAINFGGDLSWLEEDLPGLQAIRTQKPGLRIRIYHDPAQFPQGITDAIRQLHQIGVEFVAYPRHFSMLSVPFRCMLADAEDEDGRRVHIYYHHGTPAFGEPREDHLFEWQTCGPNSQFAVELIAVLNAAVGAAGKRPVCVGVSGVNNVGKTRLANRISELLRTEEGLQVKLFPDEFRVAGEETSLPANCVVLMRQLLNEADVSAHVCIYDRTVVDNLCFLRLREGGSGPVYNALAPRIAAMARSFDLIIDVRAPGESLPDTTLVRGPERELVRKMLDQFFSTFGLSTELVIIDPSNFDQTLESGAREIAARVAKLCPAGRVSIAS